MRRDGPVIDNPPAARRLALHHAERVLGAQERTGQIDVHHVRPLLERQVLDRDVAGADAGVVEQQIDPAVGLLHGLEQRCDRPGVGDIGRYHQHARRRGVGQGRGFLQHRAAAAGEDHRKPVLV